MLWIVVLVTIGVMAWAPLPPAPAMNELPDARALARLFRLLISRGVLRAGVSGTLTICVREEPQRRLVFTKTAIPEGGAGFAAEFPHVQSTEPYYDKFRAELDRRGVSYQEIGAESIPTLRFELGRDI